MKILSTSFKDLKIIQGNTFNDNRGFFREIYRNTFFKKKKFIFWFCSKSKKNVIRGLHLQTKFKQDKFLAVIKGEIFDVALDLRKNSKTYGKYFSIYLSEKNSKSVFLPAGFAHGFCGLGKENLIFYGCTNYRSEKHEVGLLWNDPAIKIKWPVKKPIVSSKDKKNVTLSNFQNLYS
jgi:dTDP-4-dehydrorhamnose 3,5-epimerase